MILQFPKNIHAFAFQITFRGIIRVPMIDRNLFHFYFLSLISIFFEEKYIFQCYINMNFFFTTYPNAQHRSHGPMTNLKAKKKKKKNIFNISATH